MNNKIKQVFITLTTLSYLFIIGVLILSITDERTYIIKETWLLLLNLILMCIGFYYFINLNNKK